MSAIEVLVIADKGLNAFSVLFKLQQWQLVKRQQCSGRFSNCSSGYTSCFVVVFAVAVVACLLILYSMKQFDNLPLHQGSHARMQFGILSLQQGNSCRVHAVWYPATANDCRALVCSLRNCRCREATCAPTQFENLPLQPCSSQVAAHVCMQHDGRIIRL
jgi:hypothetical protein